MALLSVLITPMCTLKTPTGCFTKESSPYVSARVSSVYLNLNTTVKTVNWEYGQKLTSLFSS